MKSIRHRLPNLNSLMMFESAGRHLNFTHAAEELHVTQAAVSKQIRYLEHHLGFALFQRNGRRVSLTRKGEILLGKLSTSFNYMAEAIEDQMLPDHEHIVTISANTAMSYYWLSSAITEFHRQQGKHSINIRIITSDRTQDLFGDEVDIAIAYEPGQRIGWQVQPLFAEQLFPVASPAYLQKHPFNGSSAEHFSQHKLLDFERLEPNWINWEVWFKALQTDTRQLRISGHFNNYIMLIEAAKKDQGITLGTRYLIDDLIEEGQLIRVSEYSVMSDRSYWLALNEGKRISDEVQHVFNWLHTYQRSRI